MVGFCADLLLETLFVGVSTFCGDLLGDFFKSAFFRLVLLFIGDVDTFSCGPSVPVFIASSVDVCGVADFCTTLLLILFGVSTFCGDLLGDFFKAAPRRVLRFTGVAGDIFTLGLISSLKLSPADIRGVVGFWPVLLLLVLFIGDAAFCGDLLGDFVKIIAASLLLLTRFVGDAPSTSFVVGCDATSSRVRIGDVARATTLRLVTLFTGDLGDLNLSTLDSSLSPAGCFGDTNTFLGDVSCSDILLLLVEALLSSFGGDLTAGDGCVSALRRLVLLIPPSVGISSFSLRDDLGFSGDDFLGDGVFMRSAKPS